MLRWKSSKLPFNRLEPTSQIQTFCTPGATRSLPTIQQGFIVYTEEKAKVVAASWGTELLQFLAALAILSQDELKNKPICNSSCCKSAYIYRTVQYFLISLLHMYSAGYRSILTTTILETFTFHKTWPWTRLLPGYILFCEVCLLPWVEG